MAPSDNKGPEGRIGAYVHIPFCRYRCDYCAFITFTDKDHLINDYVAACVRQLQQQSSSRPLLSTLYLGGGTPSRLSPDHVAALVAAAGIEANAEVSMECNPEDIDAALLASYVGAGITRASFGLQSTSPRALQQLGRPEPRVRVEEIAEFVARSGLKSWNLDLIYGAAGESLAEFAETVERVLLLQPPHLSIYALTVEPGTPLARTPERFPNEDHQADCYEWLSSRLDRSGYHVEEISSWSQPGHECIHHDIYWTGGDYLGIGAGAHGYEQGRRYWNTVSPERYIEAMASGATPIAGDEQLSSSRQLLERAALQLRTARGVHWDALNHEQLEALGSKVPLVERCGDRAVLTVAGRLLCNAVSRCLVER